MAILRNSKSNYALFNFTQGIEVDKRLADFEIATQLAWARELQLSGYLKRADLKKITKCLGSAKKLIAQNKFEWRIEDEDIHMNLERFVTAKLGELGKRMHLGRSRNDLIATTLRLYVSHSLVIAADQLKGLGLALYKTAKSNVSIAMPGTTHLQNGQPVLFAHALSAHAWPLTRDLKRLENAQAMALANMPIGAAALAGSPLELNLYRLAKALGFKTPNHNSYDAVADRDFMLESASALALIGVHISRLCEDLIFWASAPVGLVLLPKEWSTGSSIMPNKRNPDVAELCRAKSAKLIGAANTAHTLIKGLPFSYNSDLHELKSVLMGAFDNLGEMLEVLPRLVENLKVNKKKAALLLGQGHILATEIADELTNSGMPFREAYQVVAELVEAAEIKGRQVHELPRSDVKKLAPTLDRKFLSKLSAESAIKRRNLPGGTSPAQVAMSLKLLKKQF
jgi:argininosuccinate lyase